jgi:hypothetical protein
MEHYNKSAFPSDVVAEAKEKGLNVLDEFGVYEIKHPSAAIGKKKVDCRWEINLRGAEVKARIVGREYRWLEERDDVFAPASSSLTSRCIDFLGMKDDDDPDDPLVTFIADCISAYYQTPEEEKFYVDPPPEWLAARRVAGLDDRVI